jgi:hypothetical protein
VTSAGRAGEACWTPELADYITATRAHYRYWLRSRRQLITTALVWGGITLALTAYFGWLFQDDWSLWWPRALIVALVYAAIIAVQMPFRYYLIIPRQCRRVVEQDHLALEPRCDRWSDAGFERTDANGNRLTAWAGFYRWRETRSAFLLYFNEQGFWTLPKRALNAEQAVQLRGYLAGGAASR